MDNVTRLLMQGAAGAGSKTTYIDDVFSTYVYKGTASARSINNGIDLAGEGGMTWIKDRTNAYNNVLQDTERGAGATTKLASNAMWGAGLSDNALQWAGYISAFNNNGFSLDKTGSGSIDWANVNKSGDDYTSWTWRKQKGFFDIITWTGNGGGNRTVSHNLGSNPGCIMVKCSSANQSWAVYHREAGEDKFLYLNENSAATSSSGIWAGVTSTQFVAPSALGLNSNGNTYVAYIFAGGASTAATGPSVYFDGNDYLSLADTTDLEPGSGDFTIECWVQPDADATSYDYIWSNGWGQQISWYHSGSGEMKFRAWFNDAEDSNYNVSLSSSLACAPRGAWNHVAVVRNGNVFTLYVNGNAESTVTASFTVSANSDLPTIGRFDGSGSNNYHFKGKISNFRYTKGQALYTSNFKPSTEPLTTTSQGATSSNVKLLCCNGSTPTSSTVTPGTITNGGSTALTNSPFDDPEGFKFGEEGDQNIIKTGSYTGNGLTTGPEVYLGFEPQWLLIKDTTSAYDWSIFDIMRGIVIGQTAYTPNGNDALLRPNLTAVEATAQRLNLTSTGFKLTIDHNHVNRNGDTYIYMAIRRPDPLVGKPAEAGTDVFAMDVGNSNSTIPCFDSGFVVDYALSKQPAQTQYWQSTSRLTGTGNLETNQTRAEESYGAYVWDSNVGAHLGRDSNWQAWMWKRHAGFDVATYVGNSGGDTSGDSQVISHNLGKVPEMIWVKAREGGSGYWGVGHKDLNSGTNPWHYRLLLNENYNESVGSGSNSSWYWNDTPPTATTFSVGEISNTNENNTNFLAMLFASVDGISKVGSYTGNASASGPTITLGFAPRFIIIKCASVGGTNWFVYDTLRGLTAGNDKRLYLNTTAGQDTADDIDPSATGFQVVSTWDQLNGNNATYIYYAHA